jgi:DNA-binding response OmpR family regulator
MHQPRVLVAEDDPLIRRLLATGLRRRKLDVHLASDGSEAQRMLQNEGPWAVLLLDLMMPNVSGWDVIRWLGSHERKRPKSVIVVTAADRGIMQTLDPAVVNAIFFKPFDLFQLGAYVRACAQHDGEERRRTRVAGQK